MATTATQTIDFLSPLSLVRGFGLKRVDALQESGIETVGDLLYYFPRRYIDRSNIVPLKSIETFLNNSCTVAGTIEKAHFERGRRSRIRALLADETGSIDLLWFAGLAMYRTTVKPGVKLLVTGKVTFYKHFQMVHPLVEKMVEGNESARAPYLPVYSLSESMHEAGISHRMFSKAVTWTLDHCDRFPRPLPDTVEEKHTFPQLDRCLRQMHLPDNESDLDRYRARLRYEELYRLALTLRWSRRAFALPGRSLHAGDLDGRFRETLPFTLTEDQEKAIVILYKDAVTENRMHRLLQGDVGSGKTVVAFFACLPALACGLQVAWLAPTEVLSLQTHRIITEWLEKIGMTASLLRGGMSSAEKREVVEQLASGKIHFVVGTHALLQPSVRFKNLGMIVIDEQHKFGVEQRLALQEKDRASDFLLMSATPIPQTLARTLYGDLDIVTIARPPKGRQPIATHLVPANKRVDMERFVRSQIEEQGAAVYWVVPRIEQDEASETLRDAQTTLKELTAGTFHGISSACLHGRMSGNEKERVMQAFVEGGTRLLVSTSVIEVGVDVPHATCIVVENAERFGLAQLHQLRGRVGRGSKKSWCFLLSPHAADSAISERLGYFCGHSDGFKIADKDLALRGPGEVNGFRQTGWGELKIADIINDAALWREIQETIDSLLPKRS